jgi:hypothetical protein
MQKILICGFPHCGTTILKSIIGHIEDVYEIIDEHQNINMEINSDKKYVLCKWPFTYKHFFDKDYDNYIKIFIMRNPLFVFSSLNKRFNNRDVPDTDIHGIPNYIKTIQLFTECSNNPKKNIYTIRYEDIFENNYQSLKDVFDKIGFDYTDEIFDNSKYVNQSHSGIQIPKHKPSDLQHPQYRNWQVNQPFILNNNIEKIFLSETQKKMLCDNEDIAKIYPNLKTYFQ